MSTNGLRSIGMGKNIYKFYEGERFIKEQVFEPLFAKYYEKEYKDTDVYGNLPIISNTEKWDRRFLELAKHISQWSKDPSTKTGCVIVDDLKRVIATGYNGFPRGFKDDPEMYANRELKYKYIAHCDRNAIDNAPCPVRGMTMYLTGNPCTECQKTIVQSGIRRVVWYKPSEDFVKRWPKDLTMLQQAGIEMTEYETK